VPGFVGPGPRHYPPSEFHPYFHEPHGRVIFTLALIVAVLVVWGWLSLTAQIKKFDG
jgi:hypothetical protein